MNEMKRANARLHQRADVDLYINKIVGNEPHLTRARDISVGGVYLQKILEPDFRNHTRIGLEMKLPGSDHVIWAVGSVIREADHSDAQGVGVTFVRIAESDRQLIREFVESAQQVEKKGATAKLAVVA
ncbi:MAG: PilZ domain-containing protein [Myxococcota bacterium]